MHHVGGGDLKCVRDEELKRSPPTLVLVAALFIQNKQKQSEDKEDSTGVKDRGA